MNEPVTSRNRRLPWLLLALSLAVNGFLIGTWVTGALFDRHERRGGMLAAEWNLVNAGLPEKYREQLREKLRGDRDLVRGDFRRLREVRMELKALIGEPRPDRAAIDARLAEIRAITTRVQERGQKRIFDVVTGFPPDIRAGISAAEDEHGNRR